MISGIVVDSTTGEALPDAIVFLESTPARPIATQPRQLTDEKGRFAFVNLPGDVTFTISATRFGYLEGGYGRETMPTDPLRGIAVKTGEWISNIKVSIAKPGAISGVVAMRAASRSSASSCARCIESGFRAATTSSAAR